MLRVAVRLTSAILTWSRTCRGPGTVTRLTIIQALRRRGAAARAAAHAAPMPAAGRPAAAPPRRLPSPPAKKSGLVIISVVETTWMMSDIVLESGTWPSRMIWAPTWRTLTLAPGNAWRIRGLEVLGIDRYPDQERDGPIGLVPEGQGRRAGTERADVPEPRIRLVVERLDIGDQRVGDDDPADARGESG